MGSEMCIRDSCKSKEEVWKQVATQVVKLLNLSIIIYPVNESGGLEEPLLFPRKDMEIINLKQFVNAKEKAVVQWAVSNRHRAGTCTHTLPDADAMYLPIQSTEEVKGVMGILLEERRPVNDFEYGLLIAMLNETGVKLQDTFCK